LSSALLLVGGGGGHIPAFWQGEPARAYPHGWTTPAEKKLTEGGSSPSEKPGSICIRQQIQTYRMESSKSKSSGSGSGSTGGAGGSKRDAPVRAAGGGKKLGKGAKRAIEKNSEAVEDFVELLEGKEVRKDADLLAALCVGRVLKPLGHGRFQLMDQTGTESNVAVAGTLRAKKQNAASETCIHMGDLVLVDGGLIKGRLSAAVVRRVQEAYRALEIRVAPGLFVEGAAAGAGVAEEAGTWEFDRSEEAAAEAAEAEERRAEKADQRRKWRPAKTAAVAAASNSAAASAELDVDAI
jgi:hypothetical protein